MPKIEPESLGLMLHRRLKSMVQEFGIMMTGVPAEVLGQMQAERSLPRICKTGSLSQHISSEVAQVSHMMSEPTQSCGQASNDVCELLLEKTAVEKLHATPYEKLSEDGSNLRKSLHQISYSNKNLLIRFELDRNNYPDELIKISSLDFIPETARRNRIYLLENTLIFLDRSGRLFDLGQTEEKCQDLFRKIGSKIEYSLCDPFVLEEPNNPEDFAICDIAGFLMNKKANLIVGLDHILLQYIGLKSRFKPKINSTLIKLILAPIPYKIGF